MYNVLIKFNRQGHQKHSLFIACNSNLKQGQIEKLCFCLKAMKQCIPDEVNTTFL